MTTPSFSSSFVVVYGLVGFVVVARWPTTRHDAAHERILTGPTTQASAHFLGQQSERVVVVFGVALWNVSLPLVRERERE
jgi:hypothetical protein